MPCVRSFGQGKTLGSPTGGTCTEFPKPGSTSRWSCRGSSIAPLRPSPAFGRTIRLRRSRPPPHRKNVLTRLSRCSKHL
jgi:hypothetical protein